VVNGCRADLKSRQIHHPSNGPGRDQVRQRTEQAIAEANRLADQDDYRAALARVEFAAQTLHGDTRISSLLQRISVVRPIVTTPPGADVSFQPLEDSSDDWEIVGQTPIAEARLPRGVFRWRIQKQGYHTLELIAENHRIPRTGETTNPMSYSALNEDSIELRVITATPMVTVTAASLSLQQQLRNYVSPTVKAGGYRIGQYEVTNAEFKQFVDAGGYDKRGYWTEEFVLGGRTIPWGVAMTKFTDRTGRRGPASWEAGTYPAGRENYPVGGVSWYEAAAYAKYAGKHLPTVFHWVRAAGRGSPHTSRHSATWRRKASQS
jgi:eukaryotic-like serine/threonine-protein kinase